MTFNNALVTCAAFKFIQAAIGRECAIFTNATWYTLVASSNAHYFTRWFCNGSVSWNLTFLQSLRYFPSFPSYFIMVFMRMWDILSSIQICINSYLHRICTYSTYSLRNSNIYPGNNRSTEILWKVPQNFHLRNKIHFQFFFLKHYICHSAHYVCQRDTFQLPSLVKD